jgi:hypothetical protein
VTNRTIHYFSEKIGQCIDYGEPLIITFILMKVRFLPRTLCKWELRAPGCPLLMKVRLITCWVTTTFILLCKTKEIMVSHCNWMFYN